MGDLLKQGAAWLEAQRDAHLTHTIVYSRGAQSVELAASVGRTEFEWSDEHGVIHHLESRDFLVLSGRLVLNGTLTVPRRGDRIQETVDGAVLTYEVAAPAREPPFRYSDPYRRTLRIHVKLVSE